MADEKDWEFVGKTAIEERAWMPLCPAYPNLKGITCEEIDEFLEDLDPHVATKQWFKNEVENFKNKYEKAYREYQPRDEKFPDTPDVRFWYGGDGSQIREEFKDWLKKQLGEEHFSKMKEQKWIDGFDDYYELTKNMHRRWDAEKSLWVKLPSKEFAQKYLKSVKVYDRDEMYEAMEHIGGKLALQMWDELTLSEKEELFNRRLAYRIGLDEVDFDLSSQTLNEFPFGEIIDTKFGKKLKETILNTPNIAYITTPRGGHEMLSIFSYANSIQKRNIPSDMVKGEDGEDIGMNWLGDETGDIQKIVVVDDIVASGEQIRKLGKFLEAQYPNKRVYGAHLCHRDKPTFLYDWEISEYNRHGKEIYDLRSAYDVETVGIEQAKRDFDFNGSMRTPTCMFPHACPDGKSDHILQLIYGDERCSPERRIRRSDM